MNLGLSEEQTAVRRLARDFVDREIAPHVVAWDRAEEVDRSIVKKLGDVGFLGLTVDEEYGGSGGDHLAYCLVTEELGRGDSSVRGIVSVSSASSPRPSRPGGARSRSGSGCRGSPRVRTSAASASPNRAPDPTPATSRPGRCATATTT